MVGRLAKIKYVVQFSVLAAVGLAAFVMFGPAPAAHADPACLEGHAYIVFARGSGAPFNSNEANDVRDKVSTALNQRGYYNVGWAELGNLDGDYQVESGEYYAVDISNGWNALPFVYGPSVQTGTDELVTHLNERAARSPVCRKEAVILAGYSQGADVIGWALQRTSGLALTAQARDMISYVALYGDPKLDAGSWQDRQAGFTPWWIRGNNSGIGIDHSRSGAEQYYTREGVLGQRTPYAPADFYGRLGSWCDTGDGVCGAYNLFNLGSHTTAYAGLGGWIYNSVNETANVTATRLIELYPDTMSNNRIGALTNGTYVAKEGGLGAAWVTEMGGVSMAALSGNRIGILSGGTLYVKAGALDAPWVTEMTGVSSFALSSNRIAAVAGGTLYVKEGSLTAAWRNVATGVSSVTMSGNRIGILTTSGTYRVQEGELNAPITDIWVGNVSFGTISGNRIAVVVGGTAYVKEGALGAPWVAEISSATSVSLSGNRIGAAAYGNFYVKEGDLYAPWVAEYNGVSSGLVSGNRIAVLTGGVYLVKEGTLYAPWVTELSPVSQATLN